MRAYLAITVLLLAACAWANTQEERALQLNEEMDFLMSVAAKPKVWSSGNLPPRAKRSGPAPSQMEGIENVEDRYFTDEVNFKAAQAVEPKQVEDKEPTFEEAEDSYRVDGTVPKTN